MTIRTALASVVVLALASSACSIAQTEDEERAGVAVDALAIAPRLPRPPLPPLQLPPPPPPPPPPADPLYVGDASSIAIIQQDSDVFWAQWFAGVDDAAWLQQGFQNNAVPFWEAQQRIDALIQMYDLLAPIDRVRAAKFLERLHVIAKTLLANRDDIRGAPVDPFRGRVMPAWGAYARDRDNEWNTDVVTSGNFVYAMTAFARRVGDNPSAFCQDSLVDAIRFTTAAFETYLGFHDTELRFGNGAWAWYAAPTAYGDLACNDSDDKIAHMCEGYRSGAGEPVAFNENLSMMRALAEAALAANSVLYRNSDDGSRDDVLSGLRLFYLTNEAPVLVARTVKWFHDNLESNLWSNGAVYWQWRHQPNGVIQNTAHGGFELGSLAVIFQDKARLDAILAASGHAERIPIDTTILSGFSNAFLLRVWTYDYGDTTGLDQNILAEDIDGSGNKSPSKNANIECAGWTPLAQVDPWVWVRCRDATFKASPTGGDYLRVDNHAALLRYRQGPTVNPANPPLTMPVVCGPLQTASATTMM